jgi:DNA-binding beta-propeller fold protein YncE
MHPVKLIVAVLGLGLAMASVQSRANALIVLNSGDATVSIVDPVTRKELRRLDVGKEPHHLMRTPDGKSLIVANAASNELHFLDPSSGAVQRRLRNIPDPYQLGYSPDSRWLVVAGNRLNRVDVYAADGELKLVKSLSLPKTPSHVAFSADSQTAFVTLQDSDELAAVRLSDQTLLWKLGTTDMPAGVWMTPDDKYLMVGMTGADHVLVIDWRAQKVVKRLPTGRGAHNFRPLGDGRHVFVSNRVDNSISLVDMQTLEKKFDISVPGGPDCMELSADRRTLWVTQRWMKQVGVVDVESRKLVATIPVGRSPHGLFIADGAPWK